MPITDCIRPDSPADSKGDEPALAIAFDILSAMPRKRRNTLLSFMQFFCCEIPKERQAAFVLSVRPDFTDDEVACICGVDRRTLSRWEEFRRSKPGLADVRQQERRPTKRRASNSGGWWDLDHPGR